MRKLTAALVVGLGLGLMGPTAAQAAPGISPGPDAGPTREVSVTYEDGGRIETGISTGAEETVTAAQIKTDPSLSAAQKEVMLARGPSSVRSRTYNQWVTGGSYSVTQNGRFYYDGSVAWVTQTKNGRRGSHSCVTNYAVSTTISHQGCYDYRSSTSRRLKMTWYVTVTVGGVPINTGLKVATMYVRPNGTVSGTNTSRGGAS